PRRREAHVHAEPRVDDAPGDRESARLAAARRETLPRGRTGYDPDRAVPDGVDLLDGAGQVLRLEAPEEAARGFLARRVRRRALLRVSVQLPLDQAVELRSGGFDHGIRKPYRRVSNEIGTPSYARRQT